MVARSLKRVESTPNSSKAAGAGADRSVSVAVVSPGGEKKTAAAAEVEESGPAKETGRRRRSSRIQQQAKKKEQLARRRGEMLDEEEGEDGRVKKRVVIRRRRVVADPGSAAEARQKEEEEEEEKDNAAAAEKSDYVKGKEKLCEKALSRRRLEEEDEGGAPAAGDAKSDEAKVKETLRAFNKHYLHFVREEEKRCRKVAVEKKEAAAARKKAGKKGAAQLKKIDAPREVRKRMSKRPDLKTMTKMKATNTMINRKKRFGEIPGIKVGHQFYGRVEMKVVGLHSNWLSGIDYMGQKYKADYKDYRFPIAVAVVISGMYEDDRDNADEVFYTGQGGHNLTGDKRQNGGQKLALGNLALKNCIDQDVPVRVVRGHDCPGSYTKKIYTYDGLYKVVRYWAEEGISGFTVYKFKLLRMEGQPMLTTSRVQFVNGRVPQSLSEVNGLVCNDIAEGQEKYPILATNLVDEPAVPPSGFKYISSIQVAKNVTLPKAAAGCSCRGACMDPRTCGCAKLNGPDFPYVERDGGRLIEARDIIYECGPNCGCGPGCINRVTQRGLQYHLEVFRAPRKGWAVRSWDYIPSGAPVCEYIGVLKRSEDMETASENNYIFDIDCLQTMKGLEGRERRSRNPSSQAADQVVGREDQKHETPEFCIDAGSFGNVARFINHSCSPNLFVQCVLSSHHDMKLARVVLFAADNIPPLQLVVGTFKETVMKERKTVRPRKTPAAPSAPAIAANLGQEVMNSTDDFNGMGMLGDGTCKMPTSAWLEPILDAVEDHTPQNN